MCEVRIEEWQAGPATALDRSSVVSLRFLTMECSNAEYFFIKMHQRKRRELQ